MTNLQAAVRALASASSGPGSAVRTESSAVSQHCAGKVLDTFYGVIDATTLTLRYENAGHSPPIILRREEATKLTAGSTALGLFPNAASEERHLEMHLLAMHSTHVAPIGSIKTHGGLPPQSGRT
jgi:serine phosphatase RsbU (regulator of sigma subunit)